MSNVSSDRARELFEAAKLEGPSERAREAMWAGIQTTTAGASSLALMKGTGLASSKLALGVALGASLTVGIAATVVALTRTNSAPLSSEHVTAVAPRTLERPVQNEEVAPPPVVITGHVAQTQVQQPTAPAAVELDQTAPQRTSTTTLSEHDRLAREARMVSEARGALHRGEPETALRIVRAARNQHGARLVPEELTVEAQALRAMGDEAGAQKAEADLAGKFPEQALAH
jgi:hypothetical protein